MEVGFDGFSETMSVQPKREYERLKARADMADELMICVTYLRHTLDKALKGHPVRDADEAINFADGLRAKYDALKEQ